MHRLLAGALVALATSVVAAPSASAQEPVTKKALTFDVVVGPRDDVRCAVSADLYVPAGASKASPVAAVMGTNGFGGSKADFSRLGPAFAKRGYAFLAYSGLGFGGSGCKITLDDRDWDGKAGSQLVSFLGGSKAARDGTKVDFVTKDAKDHTGAKRDDDPRVGMIGGSYGGQIQFAIAGVDPRLDAIVPQITWNDLSYSLIGNNTDFERGVSARTPGVAKLDWPLLFTALGVVNGVQQAQVDPARLTPPCPNFADEVCRSLLVAATAGYPDATTTAFLRHASVASFTDRIRIPTFLSQGLHDTLFNVQEAVATWRALRAQGTPVKMLWRSSGHSGGGIKGEFDNVTLEAAYESRLALEWLDWYLRGLGDPPQLDVAFFRDYEPYAGDAAPAVGTAPSYPVADTRRFALTGADGLTTGTPAAGASTFLATPVPTGSGGGSVVPLQLDDLPGSFAAYSTPPLEQDLDVAGVPALTVRLDAPAHAAAQAADPATKLVLVARVVDVAPDGRQSVPGEIVSAARVADVTRPVRIELPGISHRFAKGHRLRVVLAQGNVLRRGNLVAGPVTVRTSPDAPSVLEVPVLGAPAGAKGSAPGGLTPFRAASDALPAQKPGAGGPPPGTPAAAKLAANRRCVSRRAFTIRLRRAPKGDRLRSATVLINGKRAKVVRGKRLRARIDLRGLPKGTVRVQVTVRTAKGRTLRSARTYRTCATAKKR